MNRVCVFCGSSPGARPAYRAAAEAMGRMLGERGMGLVYGGAHVGTMGTLADAALGAGAEVVGVITEALVDHEVAHTGLGELRVVATMHERKSLMAELSDGFVALRGGLGTLEELFEAITWNQLGIHAKPCGVLDIADYYAPLLAFLDGCVRERFVTPAHRAGILRAMEPGALLDAMEAWRPAETEKWIDREPTP